ncbi:MAG: Tim44/TimA family putative adaptor protein [Pseudomonadota bacterium]
MGDLAFLDIIFFAMVAAFLILRLRGVLGRRTGEEKPERWRARPPEALPGRGEISNSVTRLPDPGAPPAAGEPSLEAVLTQIKVADSSFDPRSFASGARAAFEIVVAAFAQGDTTALRPLLSDEVYDNFAGEIGQRQQAKRTLETSLVGIRSAEIVDARMDGRTAVVTVKFVSDQVNVTRDAAGEVVEGDPNHVTAVTDVWTFARNTRSQDPNWALVATSTPS